MHAYIWMRDHPSGITGVCESMQVCVCVHMLEKKGNHDKELLHAMKLVGCVCLRAGVKRKALQQAYECIFWQVREEKCAAMNG